MSRAQLHTTLVAALLLAAGCPEATQVIVSVEAEEGLMADIDALRIRVEGRDGVDSENTVEKLDETLTGEIDWPVKLAFKPADDDADRAFWVEVTGSEGSTVLATARLVTGYVEGETRYAKLVLEDSCRGVQCLEMGETCTDGGCVPAYIDPKELGDSIDKAVDIGGFTDGGTDEPDGGSGEMDSGAGSDAGDRDAGGNGGEDAGPDATTPPLECTTDSQCTADDEPICDAEDDECRPCTNSPECTTRDPNMPLCVEGHCLQCADDDDCRDEVPVCNDGICEHCARHADCPTGVCNPDGTCEPTTTVVYLDTTSGVTSGCGTQVAPCLYLSDALDLLSFSRNILKIAPSSPQYLQFEFTTAITVRIVAEGVTLNLLGTNNGPGIAVSGGANITVEGLSVLSAQDMTVAPNTPGTGATCVNSSLTLRRVTIKTSESAGVSSSNCALEISDSLIEGNGQYGISLSNGSALVQRSIIRDNLRGGVSVYGPDPARILNNLFVGNSNTGNYDGAIRGNGAGTDTIIAFNSFYDNSVNQNYIGLLGCEADWVVDSNIVWGNHVGPPGNEDPTQMFINCTVTNSITEAAAAVNGNGSTFTGVLTGDPLWQDAPAGDFGLQSGSPALNIGTAAHAGTLDQSGLPRTNGTGPDLGCYER